MTYAEMKQYLGVRVKFLASDEDGLNHVIEGTICGRTMVNGKAELMIQREGEYRVFRVPVDRVVCKQENPRVVYDEVPFP